ncbi:hypothetical protein Gotri_027818 [Gossypium trilobum]|uniref:Pentatricopeptide repeat-containing protein n=2 Tax=Gossypium TaxID=3633 RepID=A0A7J9KEP3_9ROSI|nr:hypothetical protein [Gossypium trilobum]MBA0844851.1 hypothetical protein [Gossypium armourianum]
MLTFGLYRSPTTSHSVIQALSKALELSLAITYLTRMGLKNDAQTYAMVISYLLNDDNVIRALCRVGKVSLAVRYLTRMGFKK